MQPDEHFDKTNKSNFDLDSQQSSIDNIHHNQFEVQSTGRAANAPD